jgi:hypothetical protein
MKLSMRESILGWVTMVVVLVGVSMWVGESRYKEWQESIRTRKTLGGRLTVAQHLLGQEQEIRDALGEIRKNLPPHPVGKDVTAEMLKTLEKNAQESNVTLFRREPEKEKSAGDLYWVEINCTWEADLEALVRFLYALQGQGVILDVRQINMNPAPGAAGRLKGSFSVDCAYSRTTASAAQAGSGAVKK